MVNRNLAIESPFSYSASVESLQAAERALANGRLQLVLDAVGRAEVGIMNAASLPVAWPGHRAERKLARPARPNQ